MAFSRPWFSTLSGDQSLWRSTVLLTHDPIGIETPLGVNLPPRCGLSSFRCLSTAALKTFRTRSSALLLNASAAPALGRSIAWLLPRYAQRAWSRLAPLLSSSSRCLATPPRRLVHRSATSSLGRSGGSSLQCSVAPMLVRLLPQSVTLSHSAPRRLRFSALLALGRRPIRRSACPAVRRSYDQRSVSPAPFQLSAALALCYSGAKSLLLVYARLRSDALRSLALHLSSAWLLGVFS